MKQKKTSVWTAYYKGEDWAAYVVGGSPAEAKALFQQYFKDGDPAKIRCINQKDASGAAPGVLLPGDHRLNMLGLQYKKRSDDAAPEPEEGGAEE